MVAVSFMGVLKDKEDIPLPRYLGCWRSYSCLEIGVSVGQPFLALS